MANFRAIFEQNFFLYCLLILIFFMSCLPKDKTIAVLDYTIEKIEHFNYVVDDDLKWKRFNNKECYMGTKNYTAIVL